ncbi:hypothetical protein A2533_03240 [Candidatus Falkowbacteria bacterium RIFOXYD2_FULL_35_9]|uniref:Glycosyl transferase family 1 n=1 Tax=Candidatus Falkowbacteria bacterium RIFOXYC2_FULL_36_12 TaxID=1798002 RepID=A0A1F5SWN3_9BACT|nr:MAG: hypothetical protein A2300_00710 [Candidatus Falkowbacteria bacterium RIFOXYB2_FULL_35_7]OGF30863.1 MAG: hypothetical protein A2478_00205 [Candidatus Falkowbacteria bacterium RIFOXYC2_FULL_36_12]OGF34242.1 MAG: hypothetical protein A2223_04565 [Candidatus Falkowbacteria bacterium RIFOXYA2_FULL_35_8]OGF48221.1 MAG: hypothetical protein A2533_03240 [Candidatus Falkowbacteria bacterium RIFOXYD2_FULL_35_9]
MKIAFIGQKGIPASMGGVETHVEKLAVGLHKRGHLVTVYCREWYVKKKNQRYKGVNLKFTKSWHTKNFDTITHVLTSTIDAMRQGFDVIHYHGVGPALLSWMPRLFTPSIRVVTTFHSIDRHHLKWGLLARFFLRIGEWSAVRFADETIAVSKTLQKYCRKNYRSEVIYIPNGVDSRVRYPAREIKKRYGLESGDYILFMSRLVKHKGAQYLIDAYNKIETEKKLVIAGGSAFTDKYVEKLKEKVRSNRKIIMTGNVEMGSRLWNELYSNAYLFVLPSESEGLPIVVLEAMSFGLCPLISDIPQNLEAISGGYGFKFKNKNTNSLQVQLEKLLHEPKLVKHVGDEAQKHVLENYNWKDIIKATESIYLCLKKEEQPSWLNSRINKKAVKQCSTALNHGKN